MHRREWPAGGAFALDFSTVDRRRLEAAVGRMLDQLR